MFTYLLRVITNVVADSIWDNLAKVAALAIIGVGVYDAFHPGFLIGMFCK